MQESSNSLRQPEAEFDSFASGYTAGMDNRLKRMLGKSEDDFLGVKLRWLLRSFPFALLRFLISLAGLRLRQRLTFRTCRAHYPDGPERVRLSVATPSHTGLPRISGGSASITSLSGPGSLLRMMRQEGLGIILVGCDVSHQMLEEARRCWPARLPMPDFHAQEDVHHIHDKRI